MKQRMAVKMVDADASSQMRQSINLLGMHAEWVRHVPAFEAVFKALIRVHGEMASEIYPGRDGRRSLAVAQQSFSDFCSQLWFPAVSAVGGLHAIAVALARCAEDPMWEWLHTDEGQAFLGRRDTVEVFFALRRQKVDGVKDDTNLDYRWGITPPCHVCHAHLHEHIEHVYRQAHHRAHVCETQRDMESSCLVDYKIKQTKKKKISGEGAFVARYLETPGRKQLGFSFVFDVPSYPAGTVCCWQKGDARAWLWTINDSVIEHPQVLVYRTDDYARFGQLLKGDAAQAITDSHSDLVGTLRFLTRDSIRSYNAAEAKSQGLHAAKAALFLVEETDDEYAKDVVDSLSKFSLRESEFDDQRASLREHLIECMAQGGRSAYIWKPVTLCEAVALACALTGLPEEKVLSQIGIERGSDGEFFHTSPAMARPPQSQADIEAQASHMARLREVLGSMLTVTSDFAIEIKAQLTLIASKDDVRPQCMYNLGGSYLKGPRSSRVTVAIKVHDGQ
jgi:hypothetical protein